MASEPQVYWNGRFLPQGEARLPLNDAGFVWGATVTDLCRTFRQQPYRLADHLQRFRQSCRLAAVPLAATDAELTAAATELVRCNGAFLGPHQELALVFLATPGPIGYYLGEPGGAGDGPPTLIVHTFPLPLGRYARWLREGARLVIPAVRHLPAVSVPPQAKVRSRLFWWRAEQEAHAADPAASALLLDPEGFLTETAAANHLLVRGGAVLTPRRERVLPGISLAVVEELCRDLGLPFAEADLRREDLATADEALLTCTSFCLAPVAAVDGRPLACPGPIFERLLAAWSDRVGVDVRAQILG
jgi:branched-subunit amino acid aminotransferase/4-amino-4-deoxychorismate lyase